MNRRRLYNMGGGRYIDRLEQRDGRWGILVRECVRDWSAAGHSWLTELEAAAVATMDPTARDRSDPSYERPLTVRPGREDLRRTYWRSGAL